MTVASEPQWEKAAKTKMGAYLTSIEIAFIKKKVDFSQTRFIADVGCGGGKYTRLALQSGAEVVSLDRDLDSLRWLRQSSANANPVLADAAALPLREGAFDGLFLIEIFDYIAQSEALLMDCGRALKADGLFVLSFGNTASLKSKLKQLRGNRYMQDRHSQKQVMQMLKDAGFLVTGKVGYNWLTMDRQSNSRVIPTLAQIVRLFQLHKLPSYSPWVMVSAKNRKS